MLAKTGSLEINEENIKEVWGDFNSPYSPLFFWVSAQQTSAGLFSENWFFGLTMDPHSTMELELKNKFLRLPKIDSEIELCLVI